MENEEGGVYKGFETHFIGKNEPKDVTRCPVIGIAAKG